MERNNVWKTYKEDNLNELNRINDEYKKCLDFGKTERECVDLTVKMAEENGYRNIKEIINANEQIKAGDKIYAVCMGKAIVMFRIGIED